MNRNVIEFPTKNNSLYEIQHSNWNTESHFKYLSFIIKEPNCVLYGAKESFGSVCGAQENHRLSQNQLF